MRQRHTSALSPEGFHRIAYTEWGEADNPDVVVCCHGLTRNGRDFDYLAAALSDRYRVICPDVVGRGESDWLQDKSHYGYPLYVSDAATLIAHLGVDQVDWVGTSMGGIIGMALAAQPRTPVRRLLLNDIGSYIPKAALERIITYTGTDPLFGSLAEVESHLRLVNAPFGLSRDEHWQHLARYSARTDAQGGIRLKYDPGIAEPLRALPVEDIDLGAIWAQVSCPVCLLRGADSDVLLRETVTAMARPGLTTIEVPGVGHAPMFMESDQIALVEKWLDKDG